MIRITVKLALPFSFAICLASAQQQPVMTGELASAGNSLGFALFSELAAAKPGKNLFISPPSVEMCLSMALNGAAGTTQSAMMKTLGVTGMKLDAVNRANAALMKELTGADPKVKLSIANSLWARKGISFKQQFLDATRAHYSAQVSALDFGSSDAVRTINSWVSDKTNGLIKEIIDQIGLNDILFLINAIYFKGTWTEQFDKAMTYDRDFYFLDGAAAKRKMMQRGGKFRYFGAPGFQAVRLPYGNGRLAMYLFVPEKRDGIDAFLADLTPENWDGWLAKFYDMEGDVTLPRFKLEYEANLNEPLAALGMKEAFQPGGADFTNMVKAPMEAYISEVKHKTFVEVNEEGTEAAAVTSTRVALTAMPQPHERFSIVADHPFFCAIRDDKTGTILFMGAITDPVQ